ncbi:MAG: glycosyltransferase family 4 protein [Methanosarcina sp.]|uniref:glycosyltransferase family 4 protein n=1 Tax=Methanosarcina sp. TaxID=2213 RepID=UPI0026260FF6|nr:glycosyltransferase family 4 protein [Methanosarcina sp.]MDD3245401.1 glycosyltransferase family 4 protein [Methanosarcina sp.]MDD4249511.1 glycosyltransferase family 4 protein [Methanosarcina sp.]
MVDKVLSEGSVTLIGSLPPIKGISPYCCELMLSLSKIIPVEFIGFEKMYPDFLYPGGKSKEEGNISDFSQISNVSIRNFLTYYNPFTWIWAGLSIKSKVVHAQWWSHVLAPVYFVILSICKLRGNKIIITIHNVTSHENNGFNQFLNRSILFFGDHFIVHSSKNSEQLSEIYSIPKEIISLVPIGSSISYNTQVVSQNEAREKLKLPLEKKIILFFGHIREYKGLDVLLEAFATVTSEMNDILLVIAGTPWEKWDKYEEIIQKYNLTENIKLFLQFIPSDDVKYFYHASDVVVLPYKDFTSQSAVGSVTLSFGKPLIVSNVGGLSEFVTNKDFVVEPNNSCELADKILSVLRDEILLKILAEDSKKLADEYSWDKVADKTVSLYSKLLE